MGLQSCWLGFFFCFVLALSFCKEVWREFWSCGRHVVLGKGLSLNTSVPRGFPFSFNTWSRYVAVIRLCNGFEGQCKRLHFSWHSILKTGLFIVLEIFFILHLHTHRHLYIYLLLMFA